MGKSIFGIAYLIFGFFNFYWALRIFSVGVSSKEIGLMSSLIVNLAVLLDLLAFAVVSLFALFLAVLKGKAAIVAFTNPKRILKDRLKLH